MILHLVRHGESEGNAGLSGEIDSGLTALGRRQTESAATRLAKEEISAILCSPFCRTIESAIPLCKLTGVELELFPPMTEWFCEEWPILKPFSGRTLPAIANSYSSIGVYARPSDAKWWPDWPEPLARFRARCTCAVEEIRERFGQHNNTVAVYGHASSSLGLASVLLGQDYWSGEMAYNNAELTTVRIDANHVELIRFRDPPDVE